MLLNDVMIKQLVEKDPTFIQPFEGRKMKFGARMWWQLLLTRRENKRTKTKEIPIFPAGEVQALWLRRTIPAGTQPTGVAKCVLGISFVMAMTWRR